MAKKAHQTDFAQQVRPAPRPIYEGWGQTSDQGQGSAGSAKGDRLPFEPVLQKPGAIPFKVKGR